MRDVWLSEGDFDPDPAYVAGGDFLRSIGMRNQAEISRILDVAMNPDSLFLSPSQRKCSTASVRSSPSLLCVISALQARRLSVERDMRPVVDYLRGLGIEDDQIIKA